MILFHLIEKEYGCNYGCKAGLYYEKVQMYSMSDKVNEPDNAYLLIQVGIYVFQLMDHYTAIVSIMFLAFFEVVGVCWIYGERETSERYESVSPHVVPFFFHNIKKNIFQSCK